MATADARHEQFWDIADEMLHAGLAEEGTMMGHRCLRAHGAFFASAGRQGGELIVKLPQERVAALIDAGVGTAFAPAGRPFRQWICVLDDDPVLWRDLMQEAREFVLATS